MEQTEIIRKIDTLGRIVIPKDIRSFLKIKTGSDIAISVIEDKIILKKQDNLSYDAIIDKIIKAFSLTLQVNILLTSFERIVAYHLVNKNVLVNKELDEFVTNIIINRREKSIIIKNLLSKIDLFFIVPIVVNGDVRGSIITDVSMINNSSFKVLLDILKLYLE